MMILLLSLLFAALPAGAESAWRRPLGSAVEHLGADLRAGRASADFPEGLLQGLVVRGELVEDRAEPLIEQLNAGLALEPETLELLPARSRNDALLAAIGAVVSETRRDGEKLLLRSSWIDVAGLSESPAAVRKDIESLLRRRRLFAERDLRQRLERESKALRARLARGGDGLVEDARAEAEDGLRLRVTRNFLADTKAFGREDWRRLQREIDKIGPALERDERPTGERGNLKFITGGELAGLSEIKTGPQRTNRVIWTYDRAKGRVVLLRHVQRADIEPESSGHRGLVAWTDAAHVENQLADASLELRLEPIIPVKRKRRVAVGRPFD